MTQLRSTVCVFAPSLFLTLMVESAAGEGSSDELHLHPGGQGFWIARMLRHFGERPVVVAPVGGEAGCVLQALVSAWKVDLVPVEIEEDSPTYLHDRRSGQRHEIARSRLPSLNRHEVDELYGRILNLATSTGTCVVTGRPIGEALPLDFYRRLGADLNSTGASAIGDLHGQELAAFLDGGPLHTLKVSDEDLMDDQVLARDASLEARVQAIDRYCGLGAERVIISAADHPTLARFGDRRLRAQPPKLEVADPRGAGDAMTAGLVMATLRRLDPIRALQIACAAGAANVTRRGLGSADAELVENLANHVQVEELGSPPPVGG